MSLAHGRHYLAIPGPSVVPDRVLQAMHQPSPNIYAGPLVDMVDTILPDLKKVARTEHHVAIYIANGHGAWEAAVANIFSPDDEALALATGRFTKGWVEMARAMGVNVRTLDFGMRNAVDLERFRTALLADSEHRIKAVMTTQVDTSTSVRNDIKALRDVLDETGHPALLMIDCIACLACDDFHMDAWGVDVMVAGSQKGLMTPPGLGFVYFNDKADEAREAAACVTSYWDWRPRVGAEMFYQLFCGTAPTHHLFGLREALDMLLVEEGLEEALARHAILARAIWAAAEAWGQGGSLKLNVADPDQRSHAVTSLRIDAPDGTRLREWLSDRAGVTLGIGLGMADPSSPDWHGFFRIGHMGHVNAHMVLGLLSTIEAGFTALDIPHGPGALTAAAKICAEA
ncbi:MAG: aminotransferase class V-fold PLP-dependent enzyme [Pseudomonadota bacterium]